MGCYGFLAPGEWFNTSILSLLSEPERSDDPGFAPDAAHGLIDLLACWFFDNCCIRPKLQKVTSRHRWRISREDWLQVTSWHLSFYSHAFWIEEHARHVSKSDRRRLSKSQRAVSQNVFRQYLRIFLNLRRVNPTSSKRSDVIIPCSRDIKPKEWRFYKLHQLPRPCDLPWASRRFDTNDWG